MSWDTGPLVVRLVPGERNRALGIAVTGATPADADDHLGAAIL